MTEEAWCLGQRRGAATATATPSFLGRIRRKLYAANRSYQLTLEEFEGPRYQLIAHIRKLMAEGILGPDLRFATGKRSPVICRPRLANASADETRGRRPAGPHMDVKGIVSRALAHDGVGDEIYALAAEIYPICRSISGNGVRQTLRLLGQHLPLDVHEVPTRRARP